MQTVRCRNENCKWPILSTVLDLGDHPWCNDFLEEEALGKERYYPLILVRCPKCTLLQIDYTVPKETMFGDHDYLSGSSKELRAHFSRCAKKAIKIAHAVTDDEIIDIGGNDGTQLQEFRKLGYNGVCNVESSAKTAKISQANGIFTINKFFNEETAREEFPKGYTRIINAAGVLFHLEELDSVIKGVTHCLEEDGIFMVQFGYAGQVIQDGFYDFIYHEHLCLFDLTSLTALLKPYGLHIKSVFKADIHNGSLVAFFSKTEDRTTEDDIEIRKILHHEEEAHAHKHCVHMGNGIEEKRNELRLTLEKLHREGNRIFAYGAPAKGNTLLNYCGIQYPLVEKSVEVNKLKIGKFLPGSHIPIVKEGDDSPDYYLMLSHNLRERILRQYKGTGTKFIIPLPDIKIVET